jgi:hypothetical protein
MKYFIVLALVAIGLLGHSQTNDRADGKIKGNVIDQDGNPVVAANVYAVPQDLVISDLRPRTVKTGRNGEFDFRGGLAWGTYKLYSRNDKDAYPDPFDVFYADSLSEAPKVDLNEGHPVATATLTLEKAGLIEGRVLDATSGKPVPRARVMFMDKEGNGHAVYSASADGKYRALLPTGKDLIVAVSVTGLPPDRMQMPVAPLRMEAGGQLYLDLFVTKP